MIKDLLARNPESNGHNGNREKILCLGMSYPCVQSQMEKHEFDPTILDEQESNVEQAVECARRGILTEMDARDLARCVATEEACDVDVYTVSKENGAVYRSDRHIHADFNARNFVASLKEAFGHDIQFRQIILDYYWMPTGWLVTRWGKHFFQKTLPDLVRENLLVYPSKRRKSIAQRRDVNNSSNPRGNVNDLEEGVVYLPFCSHCCKEIVGGINVLKKYYSISFVKKDELKSNALWKGTYEIDPFVMQTRLGKRIDQEEIYCTFRPKDIFESMEDAHVSKHAVMKVLTAIEDYDNIRFIRLRPLRQHEPPSVMKERLPEPEKGGFVGLVYKQAVRDRWGPRSRVVVGCPPSQRKRLLGNPKQRRQRRQPQQHHQPNNNDDNDNGNGDHDDDVDVDDDYDETSTITSKQSQQHKNIKKEIHRPTMQKPTTRISKVVDQVETAEFRYPPFSEEDIPIKTYFFPRPAHDLTTYMDPEGAAEDEPSPQVVARGIAIGSKSFDKKSRATRNSNIARETAVHVSEVYEPVIRSKEPEVRQYMSTNPRSGGVPWKPSVMNGQEQLIPTESGTDCQLEGALALLELRNQRIRYVQIPGKPLDCYVISRSAILNKQKVIGSDKSLHGYVGPATGWEFPDYEYDEYVDDDEFQDNHANGKSPIEKDDDSNEGEGEGESDGDASNGNEKKQAAKLPPIRTTREFASFRTAVEASRGEWSKLLGEEERSQLEAHKVKIATQRKRIQPKRLAKRKIPMDREKTLETIVKWLLYRDDADDPYGEFRMVDTFLPDDRPQTISERATEIEANLSKRKKPKRHYEEFVQKENIALLIKSARRWISKSSQQNDPTGEFALLDSIWDTKNRYTAKIRSMVMGKSVYWLRQRLGPQWNCTKNPDFELAVYALTRSLFIDKYGDERGKILDQACDWLLGQTAKAPGYVTQEFYVIDSHLSLQSCLSLADRCKAIEYHYFMKHNRQGNDGHNHHDDNKNDKNRCRKQNKLGLVTSHSQMLAKPIENSYIDSRVQVNQDQQNPETNDSLDGAALLSQKKYKIDSSLSKQRVNSGATKKVKMKSSKKVSRVDNVDFAVAVANEPKDYANTKNDESCDVTRSGTKAKRNQDSPVNNDCEANDNLPNGPIVNGDPVVHCENQDKLEDKSDKSNKSNTKDKISSNKKRPPPQHETKTENHELPPIPLLLQNDSIIDASLHSDNDQQHCNKSEDIAETNDNNAEDFVAPDEIPIDLACVSPTPPGSECDGWDIATPPNNNNDDDDSDRFDALQQPQRIFPTTKSQDGSQPSTMAPTAAGATTTPTTAITSSSSSSSSNGSIDHDESDTSLQFSSSSHRLNSTGVEATKRSSSKKFIKHPLKRRVSDMSSCDNFMFWRDQKLKRMKKNLKHKNSHSRKNSKQSSSSSSHGNTTTNKKQHHHHSIEKKKSSSNDGIVGGVTTTTTTTTIAALPSASSTADAAIGREFTNAELLMDFIQQFQKKNNK